MDIQQHHFKNTNYPFKEINNKEKVEIEKRIPKHKYKNEVQMLKKKIEIRNKKSKTCQGKAEMSIMTHLYVEYNVQAHDQKPNVWKKPKRLGNK